MQIDFKSMRWLYKWLLTLGIIFIKETKNKSWNKASTADLVITGIPVLHAEKKDYK